MHSLNRDQLEALRGAAQANERDALLIALAVEHGLRPTEGMQAARTRFRHEYNRRLTDCTEAQGEPEDTAVTPTGYTNPSERLDHWKAAG
jgi:hypothetical protein